MKINSWVRRLIYWPLAQEDGSGEFSLPFPFFALPARSRTCAPLTPLQNSCKYWLVSTLVNKVVVIMTRLCLRNTRYLFVPTWKATRYIHLWTLRLFFASATRSQRDEEWQKLGAANMWQSTSRSAVDRCEESPSELSPGFARHNIKMTTARTERNCLWTLKCVTRWWKEEDWRFFIFNGNWNIGWYCRMWFLQLMFCCT